MAKKSKKHEIVLSDDGQQVINANHKVSEGDLSHRFTTIFDFSEITKQDLMLMATKQLTVEIANRYRDIMGKPNGEELVEKFFKEYPDGYTVKADKTNEPIKLMAEVVSETQSGIEHMFGKPVHELTDEEKAEAARRLGLA